MRRPTTLRQASGKRKMWPHVVDARRLAPVCMRTADGWETRLEPFTPTEDMRPVCTKCRERIEDGHDREYDEKRAGFFRHASYVCPSKQPTYYIKGDPAAFADAMRKAIGPDRFMRATATASSVEFVPAPPVDEELERERKRLVGKRVRFSGQEEVFVATEVARDARGDIVVALNHHGVAQSGEYSVHYFEVIPDAKPRETTFGELDLYEWFIAPSGNLFQKITREIVFYHHGSYNEEWIGGPDIKVTRCDPPSKEAAPF